MNQKDLRKIKAIEKKNKGRILSVCPNANENSGIYFMKRYEGNFKFAYIGQAKHLLTRLAGHLIGYQHIDLSIKKHGLYDEIKNPTGWQIGVMEAPTDKLDELEKKYIALYANKGFQMRNKTDGGQGEGKHGIDNNKPSKTYRDGLAQGYKNAQKYVSHLFDLHLDYKTKKEEPGKLQLSALKKFEEFLNGETK